MRSRVAGFTFTGWNTASDGSGAAYADGATYAFTADTTLYAQWVTVADPPTGLAAVPGNGSASVAFTAPANNGGSTITGYTITCTSSNGGATATASGSGSPIVVSGLTNGNTYTCTATATNAVGTSTPSGQSNGFVPIGCSGTCVSVGDRSMLEGDGTTQTMMFPVTLSQPATTTVTVHYAVTGTAGATGATGGTKAGNGVDFKLTSGTITFTPNGTGKTPIAKTISVTVYGDTTDGTRPNVCRDVVEPVPGSFARSRHWHRHDP